MFKFCTVPHLPNKTRILKKKSSKMRGNLSWQISEKLERISRMFRIWFPEQLVNSEFRILEMDVLR